MSPQTITDVVRRDCPTLVDTMPVGDAVRAVLDSGLPALPVVDAGGRYTGIFGEREFIAALFPKYVGELQYAGFVPRSIDSVIDKRARCRHEPVGEHMNREHIDVAADASDVHLAETFLHHRVLIVPVVDGGSVVGVVTRSDFFRATAERFLGAGG